MSRRLMGFVFATKDLAAMRDPSRQWRDAKSSTPARPVRRKSSKRPTGEHPDNCLCRECQR